MRDIFRAWPQVVNKMAATHLGNVFFLEMSGRQNKLHQNKFDWKLLLSEIGMNRIEAEMNRK